MTTTAKATHTPGPWRAKESTHRREFSHWIVTEDDKTVAAVAEGPGADANAAILEAAPELLAALEGLLASHIYADAEGPLTVAEGGADDDDHRAIIAQARAAIAKATA